MAIQTYILIITLNENGLNASIKRHRLVEWIQKHDLYICCLQDSDEGVVTVDFWVELSDRILDLTI